MKSIQNSKLPALYLRLAIGSAYLWEVADRLGILGKNGQPHVGWGDWAHFVAYARQVMGFLPSGLVPALALLATLGEGVFGLMILVGLYTRLAAIGSGILSFCFAIAMAISFGIDSPLGYSVFTLSGASFLLATLPQYEWSIDALLERSAMNRRLLNNSLMAVVAGSLLLPLIFADRTSAQTKPNPQKITEQTLLKQLLNEKGISNREVQMEVVNFPPGSSSPAHQHPCPTFGYVLEGEIESVFDGKHHLYHPGDSFYEKSYGVHSLTRNNSTSVTARLLVFFVNEPAKPNSIQCK